VSLTERQGRLVIFGPGPDGTIPLAAAEADARAAAAGEAHHYSWKCLRCYHVWGSSRLEAYADPKWCPQCTVAGGDS
jgi:hypothetical protein